MPDMNIHWIDLTIVNIYLLTDKPLDGLLDPRTLSVLLILVMVLCYWFFA